MTRDRGSGGRTFSLGQPGLTSQLGMNVEERGAYPIEESFHLGEALVEGSRAMFYACLSPRLGVVGAFYIVRCAAGTPMVRLVGSVASHLDGG